MDKLREKFEKNKEWLCFSLAATFLCGLLAHAYCFFDNSFSHDSLNELHGAIFGSDWKIELGRIFVPFYRDLLRSDATLPWLIGILSLFWIGLAVFFVVRIFHIQSKPFVFLIAGIFSTNVTVAATAATYLHDLDCYMFSLLCAVIAVYAWNRYSWGAAVGAVFVAVSLGMYQGFISTSIVLIMFVCILDLLNEQRFKTVFFRGLKAIGMLLLGGALYYAFMQIVLKLTHITLAANDYNTLDKVFNLTPQTFVAMTMGAYADWFERVMNADSSYPSIMIKGITVILLLISAIAIFTGLRNRNIHWPEKLLCIVLIGLLPMGMNLLYILTIGSSHDLMVYAIWLIYLLVLLLGDWLAKQGKRTGRFCAKMKIGELLNGICILLVFLLMYGNVQFTNGMYLKKDQEYDAYLSLMTRVVYRMENHEGYVPQETTVLFAGLPDNLNEIIPGFKEYRNVTGMLSTDVIYMAQRDRFQAYFDYVLGTPIKLLEEDAWNHMQIDPRIADMPCYPSEGCIAVIDDVLVVKLGE